MINCYFRKGIKQPILFFWCFFAFLLEPAAVTIGDFQQLQAQDTLQNSNLDTASIQQDADTVEIVRPSPVNSPRFILPDTVEGYILASIAQFATANCPAKGIFRGTSLDLEFQVIDDSILTNITPVFVTILELRPDQRVIQFFREQYAVRTGKNLIRLIAEFSPGDYQVIYGFYLKDQLNEKYPRMYGKRCRIRIIEEVQ